MSKRVTLTSITTGRSREIDHNRLIMTDQSRLIDNAQSIMHVTVRSLAELLRL